MEVLARKAQVDRVSFRCSDLCSEKRRCQSIGFVPEGAEDYDRHSAEWIARRAFPAISPMVRLPDSRRPGKNRALNVADGICQNASAEHLTRRAGIFLLPTP